MAKVLLDMETMQLIALFSKISHATVKDCISDENQLVFIVAQGEVGKAVGAKGANIKKMEQQSKKRVKVMEYSDDICQFVANLCAPAKIKSIVQEGKVVIIESADHPSRGLIIGKNASTLRKYETITKRYFDLDEIKVK